MLPLLTPTFPANAEELERLLNESLRQVLQVRGAPVRIVDRQFPVLQEIAIDLDGAEVRQDAPPPRLPKGATSPGVEAASLRIDGKAVSVGPAAFDLSLSARDVHLAQGKDARDEIVLTLQRAAQGEIEASTTKADLESAIAEVAKREAGKHGVTIEDVRLDLRQSGERAIEAEATVRARKLVFGTTLRISGRLEIDEELNARVSNLNCAGEGAIGSLACGFLSPHLQKINGRAFPLMTFSLGEVRLRDVRLSIGDQLRVKAEFGA